MSSPRAREPDAGDLLARSGDRVLGFVAAIRATAEPSATAVWWVGGGVRDLIRGEAREDFDLAVEGDLEPFAGRLAAILGGTCRRYPRFLTAAIELPDCSVLDLAATRTESYETPAALPRVAPAGLMADLGRRDFTVNALALRLAPEPAELLDPRGGLVDLESRRLRILHPRSFRDDPTRILRGVRFEARLGYRFDDATEELARQAVGEGLVRRLSADRLRRELRLTFESWEGLPEVVRRLCELGVLKALLGDDAAGEPELDPGLAVTLAGLGARLPWLQGRIAPPERWALALRAANAPIAAEERNDLAARLGSPPEVARRWGEGPARLERTVRSLARRPAPSSHLVGELLADLDAVELTLLAAVGAAEQAAVVEFLTRIRGFELRIGGQDLVRAGLTPGPWIGAALRATREARIDGRVALDDELGYALEIAERAAGRGGR